MTLTAHAIVGASIASIVPNHPALGFVLGFGSHFLLDAIPHWDYTLVSYKKNNTNPMDGNVIMNKNFVFDLIKTSFDAFLGITAVFILFGILNLNLVSVLTSSLFWGAVGAMIPDALQFVYFKWRHEPVKSLQRLHFWIHNSTMSSNRPLGIFMQVVVIFVAVVISKLLL